MDILGEIISVSDTNCFNKDNKTENKNRSELELLLQRTFMQSFYFISLRKIWISENKSFIIEN